jgi:hypothetical protein
VRVGGWGSGCELCGVPSLYQEVNDLMSIAREYITALRLELLRRDEANPVRQVCCLFISAQGFRSVACCSCIFPGIDPLAVFRCAHTV